MEAKVFQAYPAFPKTAMLIGAQWLYITFVIYNGGLTTTKMALLAQYHRIIAVHDNMRIICLAVSLFVGIWCLIAFFWGAFQCTPVAKIWDPSIPGTCFPTSVLWYSTAVGNIVTDVMVFILPLPIVARLNLPTRQKFLVLGVLCLGFLYAPPLPNHTMGLYRTNNT